MKHFRTPAYRWIRVTLFIALGLFGVVPTAHGIWIYGVSRHIQKKERKKKLKTYFFLDR